MRWSITRAGLVMITFAIVARTLLMAFTATPNTNASFAHDSSALRPKGFSSTMITLWENTRSYISRRAPKAKYKLGFESKYVKLPIPRSYSPNIVVDPAVGCLPDRSVIYVKNRSDGFDRRDSLRQRRADLFGDLPMIFVIGQLPGDEPESEDTRKKIIQEAEKMGDILIGDFQDSYSTLPTKTLFALNHFVEHCDAPHAINIDDDTNPDVKTGVVDHLEKYQDDVVCLLTEHDEGAIPYRHDDVDYHPWRERWVMSYEDYPWDTYPAYCSGGCWGIARIAAEKMHVAASTRDFKFGQVEDVFITGVLREMGGVRLSSRGHVCSDHNFGIEANESAYLSGLVNSK